MVYISTSTSTIIQYRYAAAILLFIEHERQALPCALLRNHNDIMQSFGSADLDARATMEQRIQVR